MRRVCGLLVFICSMLGMVAPASGAVTYDRSFGEPGTGAGQLADPDGVAINLSTGDVYVTDTGNNRIVQFDAAGNFIRAWGRDVNLTTPGNVCPINPGDQCKKGGTGGGPGEFNSPGAIAVDNSSGPAAGSVYVEDSANQRVQRFTASGSFVLTWGKEVNTDGSNVCTAAETCKAGLVSGKPGNSSVVPIIPPVPSEDGAFGPLGTFFGGITVDSDGYVYVGDAFAQPSPRIQKFDSSANFIGQIAPGARSTGLQTVRDISIDSQGNIYVADFKPKKFSPSDVTPSGTEALTDKTYGPEGSQCCGDVAKGLTVDPSTDLFLVGRGSAQGCDAPGSPRSFVKIFHRLGEEVDCTEELAPVVPTGYFNGELAWTDLLATPSHELFISDYLADEIHVFKIPEPQPPVIHGHSVGEITMATARIDLEVVGNLSDTTAHVEYGEGPCSASSCDSTAESGFITAALKPAEASMVIEGLDPDTTYNYRVVATNKEGSVTSSEGLFHTYPMPIFDEACPNNLARQQTGAAYLLDCRAYELVSAADTGGYNVASDLVPGESSFGGFPRASGRALYSIKDGGVPGPWNPPNRGPDPYLAVRDAANERWNTSFVGIPADAPEGPLLSPPFSSTVMGADATLANFAFGGPEICSPCLPDGSVGVPLHRPDGSLVQGMAGSLPVPSPERAGEVREPLSADGSHLIFGSKQQFEPQGNSNGTDVTIYSRNLLAGTTEVVSTLPDGSPITAGDDVAALDVSADGSRVLIGEEMGPDGAGRPLYHLYMHISGQEESIDLTPGTTSGARPAGMDEDGAEVYYTTADPIVTPADQDTDTSVDLFRAEIDAGAAQLSRVSVGSGVGDTDACDPSANSYNADDWNTFPGGATDCSVLAIGGGAGVASGGGVVYFLSPEKLDGNGVEGSPNLFRAQLGAGLTLVTTLESSAVSPLEPAVPAFEKYVGSFTRPWGAAIDSQDDSFYVYDVGGNPSGPFGGPGAYVQKFDASGTPIASYGTNSKNFGESSGEAFQSAPKYPALEEFGFTIPGGPTQIAVDNSPGGEGDLYVISTNSAAPEGFFVRKFDSSGNHESSFKVGGGFDFSGALAVNQANGDLYVGVNGLFSGGSVRIYSQAGVFKSQISASGPPSGVAVDSSGTVYVANDANTVAYGGPNPGVIDPNQSFGVSVDPATDRVYVDEGNQVAVYEGKERVAEVGTGTVGSSKNLAVNSARMVVSNPQAGNVALFKPVTAPSRRYDNPMVLDAGREPDVRRTADFQTTRDGAHAAFPSSLNLTSTVFDNGGVRQIFRFAAAGNQLACTSCTVTGDKPEADSVLPSNGLGISDDGRVFFTTAEPLVLRDTNSRRDAYEWSNGTINLISSGRDQFDSGMLGVSADGVDAMFFTRETLVPLDTNGTLMKLYTARENGGFFFVPPPPPCVASDECHGVGTKQPVRPTIETTLQNPGGNAKKTCPKGKVLRKNRCVKRKKSKRAKRARHRSAKKQGGRR